MKTTLSERDGNTVKLAVEVSSEELQEAFTAKLRQLSREARIPGFRPGKAPMTMVRQRIGDEAILVDAVEDAMQGWFGQATQELNLRPVDKPKIELDNQDEIPELDKPLAFSASVTVMPEAVLGEYKGVKAVKEPVEVSEEEIDGQLARLRDEFAELQPVSGRPAGKGDFVTVDFHAMLDGQKVEGLEAADYVFDLGSNRMFTDVEQQIMGMNAGEEKTFPFAVPDGYPERLSGKMVDFFVSLKEIKEKVLPPLTDEWASEISEFKTVPELREEIRSKMAAGKENASDQLFRARAIKAAVDNVILDLPDIVVQEQTQELLADFARSLEAQGGSLQVYMAATGVTIQQMLEDMKPTADNNVRTNLVLDAIVKAEGIEVGDEEVTTVVAQMAAAGRMDMKKLEKRLAQGGRREAMREQIARDKAADLVAQHAVAIAPEPAAAEEPAAEPAPAKTGKRASAKTPAAKKAGAGRGAAAPEAAADAESEATPGTPAPEPPVAESAADVAAGTEE